MSLMAADVLMEHYINGVLPARKYSIMALTLCHLHAFKVNDIGPEI